MKTKRESTDHFKTGYLFADNEVIDLCNSIIDIHRALKLLFQFLGDLEDAVHTTPENMRNDFGRWGICAISEKFLTDQTLKLNRITEIYESETKKLIQKTKERR